MEGDAAQWTCQWAQDHFGQAELGDCRLSRRLVKVAGLIRRHPGASLPRLCQDQAALAGTYRLLSNAHVDPHAMQQPHRRRTAGLCREQSVTLVVQDGTQLDFSRRAARGSITGVGPLGRHGGGGQGLLQHTALAVTTEGLVMGVLDQQWRVPHRPPAGEKRSERRQRETGADAWARAAQAVSRLDLQGTQVIHVGDRHSDVFGFFQTARQQGHGFLVRSMHNRYLRSGTVKLWDHVASQPAADTRELSLPRRGGSPKQKRAKRKATVELRYDRLALSPPRNDPRYTRAEAITCTAIEVREIKTAKGVEPIRWRLLSSEPAEGVAEAWKLVNWYQRRWVIEQWHRVLKEGCRLESAQLDEGEDIQRLAAILGPVAADLLRLRDLASDEQQAQQPARATGVISEAMIAVVAASRRTPAQKLTLQQFWRTLARRGGHLGRKKDPRPGWSALWFGWQQIAAEAAGYELAMQNMGGRTV